MCRSFWWVKLNPSNSMSIFGLVLNLNRRQREDCAHRMWFWTIWWTLNPTQLDSANNNSSSWKANLNAWHNIVSVSSCLYLDEPCSHAERYAINMVMMMMLCSMIIVWPTLHTQLHLTYAVLNGIAKVNHKSGSRDFSIGNHNNKMGYEYGITTTFDICLCIAPSLTYLKRQLDNNKS